LNRGSLIYFEGKMASALGGREGFFSPIGRVLDFYSIPVLGGNLSTDEEPPPWKNLEGAVGIWGLSPSWREDERYWAAVPELLF